MQEREIETTVSDEDMVNEIESQEDTLNTVTIDIEDNESDIVDDSESTDIETSGSDENDVCVVSENVSVSSFDYTGNLETIIEQQSATNELLVRINEQNDFMIALSVTFMFCVVCYKILHGFSKI